MDIGTKRKKRHRRHKRVRAKVFGTAKIPRLCVFRSSKHIYTQIIDDEKNRVITSADDGKLTSKKTRKDKLRGKTAVAFQVGKRVAENASAKKVKKVVFDRGGYRYHGRVKALAEGAREGGLKF